MSDLLKRLRAYSNPNEYGMNSLIPALLIESATEIEQLRAELAALRARIDDAAVGEVVLDAEGYTAIYPPLDWRSGERVALVPLDD